MSGGAAGEAIRKRISASRAVAVVSETYLRGRGREGEEELLPPTFLRRKAKVVPICPEI